MHDTLLQNFDTLGAEGGGTLELGPGLFVVKETLNFQKYSNVSIQGSGIGRTILSVPKDPIGAYTADNGSPVGRYNATVGGPVNGTAVNFIQVSGAKPMNNFEMCNLTIDAQANNASEDWSGSLIMDTSGGDHHVYSDIEEAGFFGPSTSPNGLHLESQPSGVTPGSDYVIDNFFASNNSVPFENYPGYKGGPNFLNIGPLVNCTIDNVTGTGLVAFEVAPPRGCTIENWNISGHLLIDPLVGGTWGGTVLKNVTVNTAGTAAPNALASSVANGTGGMPSNFTALRWLNDSFYGSVLGGANLIDVENSTFFGGIDSTPAVFEGNKVVWTVASPKQPPLPIQIEGAPAHGSSAILNGDTFVFENGTQKRDPFQITVPMDSLLDDTVEISGNTTGYLLSGPNVTLSENSTISGLTYESLGDGSPPSLVLFDTVGSPGFVDGGAVVGELTRIYTDLPQYVPWTPGGLTVTETSATTIGLVWNSSTGPVTNYTVLVGASASAYFIGFSTGVHPDYSVQGLQSLTTYYFAVEAWNGSRHSAPSSVVSASTQPTPNNAPSVPTGLSVLDRGVATLGIRWDPSRGNVTNYTVFVGTNDSWLISSGSVGTASQFTVTGLAPATEYYLAVEAWNLSWTAGRSPTVNATTLPTASLVAATPLAGGPLSLADWAVLLATAAGVFASVIGPLFLVSYLRARRYCRNTGRSLAPVRESGTRPRATSDW